MCACAFSSSRRTSASAPAAMLSATEATHCPGMVQAKHKSLLNDYKSRPYIALYWCDIAWHSVMSEDSSRLLSHARP